MAIRLQQMSMSCVLFSSSSSSSRPPFPVVRSSALSKHGLNSCPTIMSMIEEPKSLPLSIEELFTKLTTDEVSLVQELVSSGVLVEILEWSSSEGKLDLHGLHLVSAFLILLQWVEELRTKLRAEAVVPYEILVVCGTGKHNSIRGESPIKLLVSEMTFRMNSPLKIDRKNVGRFVAQGKAVKDWLC